jgi:predicted O-linked N-acetylglucosamine transferase (SPINDLY family)
LFSAASSAPDDDEYTTRLKELADEWVCAHVMTEQMISERIRKDEIDIAVDLAGAIASH